MVLVMLVMAAGLGAFEYTDRFDYPEGSDGSPAWYTNSVSWEVVNGAMVYPRGQRSFIILDKAPYGTVVSFEASVMVERRDTSADWAVAGIAVRWDEKNYWHFALEEAPEAKGKRHFVELSEMLDDTWLAENGKDARLTPLAAEGSDFNWQYGIPYRLRITLAPDQIRGELLEKDGTRRARIGYALDNRAVKCGQPALVCVSFRARFDDASVVIQETAAGPEVKPPTFPPYTLPGYSAITAPATGFFYPKEISGTGAFLWERPRRWWLIDPNGQGFFVVGTDHVNYRAHWCEKLGYAPYSRNCEGRYGSEEKWGESTLDRLVRWNFNALAAGHSQSLRYKKLPHIESLSFGTAFSDYDDLCPKTTWTGFPDVFSPKWAQFCEKRARMLCPAHKDDPWQIGYFLDNELEWFGKSQKPWGLFDEAWKKPPEHSAKKAWIAFLKRELGDADAMEKHWGVIVRDWEDLSRHVEPSVPLTDRGRDVAAQWVRLCATEYFQKATDAARKYDPNHLVLGCRFAGDAPDVWDIAGDYCDVVSFNMYPHIDVVQGVPESVLRTIEDWHRRADVPLMITEWSFPALDAGLPCVHGAGMRVDTQQQRARCFKFFQTAVFSMPFMVGSDYFMWVDEPALGIGESFPEDGNYGLVNEHDEPYKDLTDTAESVNASVYEIHAKGRMPTPPRPRKFVSWLDDVPARRLDIPAGEIELRSGDLMLKGPTQGHAWRLWIRGMLLGDFYPLLQQGIQQPSEKQGRPARSSTSPAWVAPDMARVTGLARNERMTVVDMTLSGTAGGRPERAPERSYQSRPLALTRVDEKNEASEAQDDKPRDFETGWRFVVPREGGWFACYCRWVKNTGRKPWRLEEMFYYTLPALGGSSVDDESLLQEVPNYYCTGGAWVDRAANVGVGCWYTHDAAFHCKYWKDDAGNFHPDLRYRVDRLLEPGDRVEVDIPPVFIFPLEEASVAAFGRAVGRLAKTVLVDKQAP